MLFLHNRQLNVDCLCSERSFVLRVSCFPSVCRNYYYLRKDIGVKTSQWQVGLHSSTDSPVGMKSSHNCILSAGQVLYLQPFTNKNAVYSVGNFYPFFFLRDITCTANCFSNHRLIFLRDWNQGALVLKLTSYTSSAQYQSEAQSVKTLFRHFPLLVVILQQE